MDSLDDGYHAVVLGASGGLGAAFAAALRADPRCGRVTALSRSGDGLDLTRERTLAAAAARIEEPVQLLLIATGALEIDGVGPEKALKQLDPSAMAAQFALNAIGPALALKHFAPHLPRDRRALVGALSARVGSIGDNGLGGWTSYRASKAALNQILRCAAIELARTHRRAVVAALHPGTVRTPLTEKHRGAREVLEPADSAARLLAVLDGLSPEDSGCFRDWQGLEVPW